MGMDPATMAAISSAVDTAQTVKGTDYVGGITPPVSLGGRGMAQLAAQSNYGNPIQQGKDAASKGH